MNLTDSHAPIQGNASESEYNFLGLESSNLTAGNGTNNTLVDPKRQAIGVALAISGNIMISMALSVQKYAHNR